MHGRGGEASVFGGIRPVLHLSFDDAPVRPVVHAELVVLAERMLEAGVDVVLDELAALGTPGMGGQTSR